MDDGPGCARHDVADRHAVDIGRDLNDAVGVMASQVGFDAVAHHNLRLVPRSPSRNQERQPDAVQLFSRYSWHAAASYSPWDHEALIFERALAMVSAFSRKYAVAAQTDRTCVDTQRSDAMLSPRTRLGAVKGVDKLSVARDGIRWDAR